MHDRHAYAVVLGLAERLERLHGAGGGPRAGLPVGSTAHAAPAAPEPVGPVHQVRSAQDPADRGTGSPPGVAVGPLDGAGTGEPELTDEEFEELQREHAAWHAQMRALGI